MDFADFKVSRIAGHILLCLAGILTFSCNDIPDVDEPVLVINFGDGDNTDGDLYREIPAEGGSITLLSPDESANIRNLQSCYLINRPLEWFEINRVENPRMYYNLFFRTNSDDIVEEAFEGTEFYSFTDGYQHPDKYFSDGTWFIPLLYDKRSFHYGYADWLQIKIFKDKIEVEATANDTGEDRYISFIYDYSNYPFFGYGSVEVKQPALK